MEQNYIVGKNVEYTNRDEIKTGFVVDKINMLQNEVVITGYMIKNSEDQKLYPVAYWRLQHVLD